MNCRTLHSNCNIKTTVLTASPDVSTGIFQLVSLDISSSSLSSPLPLDTSFLKSLRGGGQTLYVRSLAALGEGGGRRTPFFALPASHTGNQIKSYGGYLRFQLSYRGEGAPIPGPLVIIQVRRLLGHTGTSSSWSSSLANVEGHLGIHSLGRSSSWSSSSRHVVFLVIIQLGRLLDHQPGRSSSWSSSR